MKRFAKTAALVGPAALICTLMIVGLAAVTPSGCSSCQDEIVQQESVDGQQVALIHRICGSVSGFNVSVAPSGTNTSGRADEFEPFMYVCDCYERPARRPYPVRVAVEGANTLRVTYEKRGAWQIVKQRPTQGKFHVVYEVAGDSK